MLWQRAFTLAELVQDRVLNMKQKEIRGKESGLVLAVRSLINYPEVGLGFSGEFADLPGLELAKRLGGVCLHPRSSLISADLIFKFWHCSASSQPLAPAGLIFKKLAWHKSGQCIFQRLFGRAR